MNFKLLFTITRLYMKGKHPHQERISVSDWVAFIDVIERREGEGEGEKEEMGGREFRK